MMMQPAVGAVRLGDDTDATPAPADNHLDSSRQVRFHLNGARANDDDEEEKKSFSLSTDHYVCTYACWLFSSSPNFFLWREHD